MDSMFEKWLSQRSSTNIIRIRGSLSLTVGDYGKSVSSNRLRFAEVSAVFTPSDHFSVQNRVDMTPELRGLEFPEYFVYGVLDQVLLRRPLPPLIGFTIELKNIRYNEVECTPMSLYYVGVEAGKEILAFQNVEV